MRIHKSFTYVEDRDFYVDGTQEDLDNFCKEKGIEKNLDSPEFISEFYEWLVSEQGVDPESDDYDGWYGNQMGEEKNTYYKLGE
jgi:hypothetical protein